MYHLLYVSSAMLISFLNRPAVCRYVGHLWATKKGIPRHCDMLQGSSSRLTGLPILIFYQIGCRSSRRSERLKTRVS